MQAAETKATAAETERDKIAAEFATFREQQTQRDREARFDRLVEQGKAVPRRQGKKCWALPVLWPTPTGNSNSPAEKASPVEEAFWAELEAAKPNNLLARVRDIGKRSRGCRPERRHQRGGIRRKGLGGDTNGH